MCQEQEQMEVLEELKNIREKVTAEPSSPAGAIQDVQKQLSTVPEDITIKYGIPEKSKFDKFFSSHKNNTVPTTSVPQKTSPIKVGDDSDIQLINSSSIESTASKKTSFLEKVGQRFKRRKLTSPKADSDLTVTERLRNIHGDVLEIKDSVITIGEHLSKVSLSPQVESANVESKKETDNNEFKARLPLIYSSKNIDDLLRYTHEIQAKRSDNILYCEVCRSLEVHNTNTVGIFKYDFALAEDSNNKNIPREFINLKTHSSTP